MQYLKQSTAVDIGFGPFLDETDGKTAETALTLAQADWRLKKGAGAWAQKNQSSSATHEEAGWYEVSLDTTDTGTVGPLIIAVHKTGALPVFRDYFVVPANVYDSLVGSDLLQVDVTQIVGDATAASNQKAAALVIATGTVQSGSSATSVVTDLSSTVTGNYIGRILVLGSGTLDEQATDITAYDGSTKTLTVTALTSGPAAGVTFVIV